MKDAIKALVDNNIVSVPVYDEDEGLYVGFLDVKSVIHLVSSLACDLMEDMSAADLWEGQDNHETLWNGSAEVEVLVEKINQSLNQDIQELSEGDSGLLLPFSSIPQEGTVNQAMLAMLGAGDRRVAAVDGGGKVVSMVSQSDIVRAIPTAPLDEEQTLRLASPISSYRESLYKPVTRIINTATTFTALQVSLLFTCYSQSPHTCNSHLPVIP
jgi:CBS domain-containing protein